MKHAVQLLVTEIIGPKMYRPAFIVLLCVLATCAVDQEHHERCADEAGISRDKHLTDADLTDSKTGCYIACLWKQGLSFFNEDGTLNASRLLAGMPEDIPNREEVLRGYIECTKHKGSTDCETASEAYSCFRRHEASLDPRNKKDSPLRI